MSVYLNIPALTVFALALGLSSLAFVSMAPGLPRGMAIGIPLSVACGWMPIVLFATWWLS